MLGRLVYCKAKPIHCEIDIAFGIRKRGGVDADCVETSLINIEHSLRSGRKKDGGMRSGDIALRELYRHIECSNDVGRHDEVTKIRLVRRAKTMKETRATKPALQAQATMSR